MEARILKLALLAGIVCSSGANYRTRNFVVTAPTQDMAEAIGKAAEGYRKQMALDWLGHEMPGSGAPCPITAQVGETLGAGGATSFVFDHGEVFNWQMTIQGSRERILDSVLPHEVTHTVFATHFRRPLPRWADEGACTTVEHESEKNKQQTMLIDFLKTNRGIAFNRMFAMKDYPHDVMPLYSQGYSLARYLIAQGGKPKFIKFLEDGMKDEDWNRAINANYNVSDLGKLQTVWLDWVRKGSPSLIASQPARTPGASLVADARGPRPRPEPNLIYHSEAETKLASYEAAIAKSPYLRSGGNESGASVAENETPGPSDWRAAGEARQDDLGPRPSKNFGPTDDAAEERARRAGVADASTAAYQATKQQSPQKARQIILEWNKPAASTVTR